MEQEQIDTIIQATNSILECVGLKSVEEMLNLHNKYMAGVPEDQRSAVLQQFQENGKKVFADAIAQQLGNLAQQLQTVNVSEVIKPETIVMEE